MAHLSKTHGDPCTAECRRNVFSNGRSDEDLLGVKDLLDEVISALGVEFGKHIVENEYGFNTVLSKDVERCKA
jgi:hypothetical protein